MQKKVLKMKCNVSNKIENTRHLIFTTLRFRLELPHEPRAQQYQPCEHRCTHVISVHAHEYVMIIYLFAVTVAIKESTQTQKIIIKN